jgi:hypothetical protein
MTAMESDRALRRCKKRMSFAIYGVPQNLQGEVDWRVAQTAGSVGTVRFGTPRPVGPTVRNPVRITVWAQPSGMMPMWRANRRRTS